MDSKNRIVIFLAKYIFKVLVIFILCVTLLILFNIGILPFGRLADKLNQQNVSLIKLGMSRCDVIDILGAPLNSDKSYIISAKGKIEPESIVITYMYSNPGILWDIETNVNFDRRGKVICVNMQEGDGDFFIYDNEHPTKFINLETYNRVIPNKSQIK